VVALAGPGVADSLRADVDGVIVPRPADGTEAAEGLAAAIVLLAADPARRTSMAAEALAGAERFDATGRIGEVVALYREVLSAAADPG
jgi:hypothetical protein